MRSSILLSSFSFSFSSAADTAYARRRRERGGGRRARTAPKALFCRRRSFSSSSRSSSSGDDDENENENENENDDVKTKKKKTKNATKSQKEEVKGIWKSERKRREMLLTTTLTIQTRAAFALEDFAKREEEKGVSCVDVKEGGKGQLEENDVVSVNYTLYLSDEDGTLGSKIDSAKFFVFGVGDGRSHRRIRCRFARRRWRWSDENWRRERSFDTAGVGVRRERSRRGSDTRELVPKVRGRVGAD